MGASKMKLFEGQTNHAMAVCIRARVVPLNRNHNESSVPPRPGTGSSTSSVDSPASPNPPKPSVPGMLSRFIPNSGFRAPPLPPDVVTLKPAPSRSSSRDLPCLFLRERRYTRSKGEGESVSHWKYVRQHALEIRTSACFRGILYDEE